MEGGSLTETVIEQGIKLAGLIQAEIGLVYVADATGFVGEAGYTTHDLFSEVTSIGFKRHSSVFIINDFVKLLVTSKTVTAAKTNF